MHVIGINLRCVRRINFQSLWNRLNHSDPSNDATGSPPPTAIDTAIASICRPLNEILRKQRANKHQKLDTKRFQNVRAHQDGAAREKFPSCSRPRCQAPEPRRRCVPCCRKLETGQFVVRVYSQQSEKDINKYSKTSISKLKALQISTVRKASFDFSVALTNLYEKRLGIIINYYY